VHPKDDRYKNLVGKFAFVPLINRRIHIIADDYLEIDQQFQEELDRHRARVMRSCNPLAWLKS
jgi:hypothetical protein